MQAPLYIISDNHFNSNNSNDEINRREKLFQVLNKIKEKGEGTLIIGGDFFDYWFEYDEVIPAGYESILKALKELHMSGIEIHYVLGNHDYWDFGYLQNHIGVIIHNSDLSIELNDKKILLTHGDGLLKNDYGYRFMKKIIRSKLFIKLFKLFPSKVTISLANRLSNTSHYYNHHPYDKHTKMIKKDITEFAQKKWKENFDMVLVGHYHQEGTITENSKSLTFLGDWLSKYTVTVIKDSKLWQGDWKKFLELS